MTEIEYDCNKIKRLEQRDKARSRCKEGRVNMEQEWAKSDVESKITLRINF